jgi:UDP-glucose 4-epimerase
MEGNVLDLPHIIHTIRQDGVERVIHMATTLPGLLQAHPFMNYKTDVDGALNIFEASRLLDVKRVVFTSSKAVYERVRGEYAYPNFKPIDEDYPKSPMHLYGATKLYLEHMGLNYHRVFDLDFIAVRFATTYGPGKTTGGLTGPAVIWSEIIESAMTGKSLKIPAGEEQIGDLVYHKDLAQGIVRACFAENPEHRIFHLGAGKGETLQHMLDILKKMFGEVHIAVDPGLKTSTWRNACVYNIDRARRELGYRPVYDLAQGIEDYVETTRRLTISR